LTAWMADYRVESELRLAEGEEQLSFAKAAGVRILIGDAIDPNDRGLLAVQVSLNAPDLEAADKATDEGLRRFLYLLSLVTSTGFRVRRKNWLVDWSPGLMMRDAYIYAKAPSPNPMPALGAGQIEAAQTIESWGMASAAEQAMRWYAIGVRSTVPEDQFQYFWFVVELLAASQPRSKKVADKCPTCQGDLFCPSCNTVSTHRPYQKQRMEGLLRRHEDAEWVSRFFLTRNALMHGGTRESIVADVQREAQDNIEFHDLVDRLGRAAWKCVLNRDSPDDHLRSSIA